MNMNLEISNISHLDQFFRYPLREAIGVIDLGIKGNHRLVSNWVENKVKNPLIKNIVYPAFYKYLHDNTVKFPVIDTIQESRPVSRKLVADYVKIFGKPFTDAFISIGGFFSIRADLELTSERIIVTVKNVDFDYSGDASKYADFLERAENLETPDIPMPQNPEDPKVIADRLRQISAKIDRSSSPDQALVIADLVQVLNKLYR